MKTTPVLLLTLGLAWGLVETAHFCFTWQISAVVAWRLPSGWLTHNIRQLMLGGLSWQQVDFLCVGLKKGLSSKDKCLSNQAKVISPFMLHFGCFLFSGSRSLRSDHVSGIRFCFVMGGEARSIVHHTVYYLIKPFKQPCEIGSILYLFYGWEYKLILETWKHYAK